MIGNHMQDVLPAELLDIREAAALLRVSETSLRRWTNAGRLPCLRVGGRRERRFRRSDLLAFLNGEGATGPSHSRCHFCGLYTSDLSRVREAAAFLAAELRPGTLSLLVAGPHVQRAVIEMLERDRPVDVGRVSRLGAGAARVLAHVCAHGTRGGCIARVYRGGCFGRRAGPI